MKALRTVAGFWTPVATRRCPRARRQPRCLVPTEFETPARAPARSPPPRLRSGIRATPPGLLALHRQRSTAARTAHLRPVSPARASTTEPRDLACNRGSAPHCSASRETDKRFPSNKVTAAHEVALHSFILPSRFPFWRALALSWVSPFLANENSREQIRPKGAQRQAMTQA